MLIFKQSFVKEKKCLSVSFLICASEMTLLFWLYQLIINSVTLLHNHGLREQETSVRWKKGKETEVPGKTSSSLQAYKAHRHKKINK